MTNLSAAKRVRPEYSGWHSSHPIFHQNSESSATTRARRLSGARRYAKPTRRWTVTDGVIIDHLSTIRSNNHRT